MDCVHSGAGIVLGAHLTTTKKQTEAENSSVHEGSAESTSEHVVLSADGGAQYDGISSLNYYTANIPTSQLTLQHNAVAEKAYMDSVDEWRHNLPAGKDGNAVAALFKEAYRKKETGVIVSNEALPTLPPLPHWVKCLFLDNMPELTALPDNRAQLTSLWIKGERSSIVFLQKSLSQLRSLTLTSIPGNITLPNDLSNLIDLYIVDCPNVTTLPDGMLKLNLLNLYDVPKVRTFPEDLTTLTCLSIRNTNGSKRLDKIRFPKNLWQLNKFDTNVLLYLAFWKEAKRLESDQEGWFALGIQEDRDISERIVCLTHAASAGHPQAERQLHLARVEQNFGADDVYKMACSLYEDPANEDKTLAFAYVEIAAKKGHILGKEIAQARDAEWNYKSGQTEQQLRGTTPFAIACFRLALAGKHPEAALALVEIYRERKNKPLMIDYLKIAAKTYNKTEAMYELGTIYYEQQDHLSAIRYHKMAAEKGHKLAIGELGKIYKSRIRDSSSALADAIYYYTLGFNLPVVTDEDKSFKGRMALEVSVIYMNQIKSFWGEDEEALRNAKKWLEISAGLNEPQAQGFLQTLDKKYPSIKANVPPTPLESGKQVNKGSWLGALVDSFRGTSVSSPQNLTEEKGNGL